MSPTLKNLAISSPHEAVELEQDLGIRFDDFTPEDSDTWNRQTLYLNQYARTRTFTHAARAAGVSIRTARTWQAENTLGFNHRLEIAVLEYTEEIEVLLIERVRKPDVPPSLLSMLLRAHLPEKYGPARRDGAPRDNYHDRDDDPDGNIPTRPRLPRRHPPRHPRPQTIRRPHRTRPSAHRRRFQTCPLSVPRDLCGESFLPLRSP